MDGSKIIKQNIVRQNVLTFTANSYPVAALDKHTTSELSQCITDVSASPNRTIKCESLSKYKMTERKLDKISKNCEKLAELYAKMESADAVASAKEIKKLLEENEILLAETADATAIVTQYLDSHFSKVISGPH